MLYLPSISLSEADGVRCLHLESPWIQGTMRIKEPFAIELEYVQRMMAWLLFMSPSTVKDRVAMQLGLGAAAITKSCYKTLGMKTVAIEINPQVVAACRQWFKLPPDNTRLAVVLADAAKTIQETRWQGMIDALAVDLYDHEAAAPVLDSAAFYADCRSLLSDEGAMAVNLFGRSHSYEKSLEKIQSVFGSHKVWAFKPTREGNTVVLAFRSSPSYDREVMTQRAQVIETRWHLPAGKWLKILKPLQ